MTDKINPILEMEFTPDELAKLNSVMNSCVVSLRHQMDINDQMKEMVAELASELEIKPQDIMEVARTLFKQTLPQKRAKQQVLETLMIKLGYDIDSE